MLHLIQSPAVSEHFVEAVGLVAAYAIKAVFDHKKGSRRDVASGSALSRIETSVKELRDDVVTVQVEVGRLGAKLENGLSDDIRELKGDVKAINQREIDRVHGPYDRRGA